jgi:NADH-quinone oxidoreductase subunit J
MTAADFAFYMFAIVTVSAGLMVTISRNPVHSVLWLILAFLSTSGLFVLLGAEFVAMLLVIVYVGAVAVLFLFVVMMLDIDFAALKGELARYMPLGLLDRGGSGHADRHRRRRLVRRAPSRGAAPGRDADRDREHPRAGDDALRPYFLLFQLPGLILLVAMIGAILLTLRHRKDVKRQNVLQQMWRDPAKAMELKDVKPGQGL